MASVKTEVEEIEMEGDYATVAGLEVTCSKCGYAVEVYGTGGASARRAAIMLREECPEEENNFYVVEWDDE